MALVPYAAGTLVPSVASAVASSVIPAVLSAVGSEPARKIARHVGQTFAQAAARRGTDALRELMRNRLSSQPRVVPPSKGGLSGGPPRRTLPSARSGPHMGPIQPRYRPSRRALYLSYRDSRVSRRRRRWRRRWW